MAQTLEQLFKTKPVGDSGETAEVKYEIRDSKLIPVRASNSFEGFLINNTGFVAARGLRKELGFRTEENLLEEETTGIRIIRAASEPILYGTDLTRIVLRSTPLLDKMKQSSYGAGDTGLLGGAISGARDFVNNLLGIPAGLIPSKIIDDNRVKEKGQTQNRMIDLADIKNSAEGKFVGRLLKSTGGGNLSTIGTQAAGNLASFAKDKIRGKLFGDRSVTGFNPLEPSKTGRTISYNYGSLDSNVGIVLSPDPSTGNIDVSGLRYSKTINLTSNESSDINFIDASDEGGLAKKTPGVVIRRFQVPALGGFPAVDIQFPNYSQLFNNLKKKTSEDTIESGTNTIKREEKSVFPTVDSLKNEGENDSVLLGKDGYDKYSNIIELTIDRTRFSADPDRIPKSIISKREMDTKTDGINASSVYTDSQTESDRLADLDFVSLKFKSIHTGKAANFRATINSLNETFTPSWDSAKFVGSAFNYYTYNSIERGVTFNFKVFSLNATEHKNAWDKVNFLTSLVYPQGYYDSSAVIPPLIEFNLGDMFKNRVCFIESLSYTYDDNNPWQVTNTETTFGGTEENMIGYRLPTIVDVAITLKFLESRGVTGGKKFYSFEPVN